MAEYIIQEETLVGIADAIRSKTGESGQVAVADMAEKISGIAVDEKVETTVALDFSAGDMEVVPEDGTVFSSVSIPTPTTLIPENIAEGVDIAGIIGTLAAGSGSGAKIASGEISGDQSVAITVSHNLGVIPDIVVLKSSYINGYGYASLIIGISSALAAVIGYGLNIGVKINSTGKYYIDAYSSKIDQATGITQPIHKANETTFGLAASSTYKIRAKSQWFAIGGLT